MPLSRILGARFDYVPDEDNGGNGMNTLQRMLMQSEGRRILLLPAWPKHVGLSTWSFTPPCKRRWPARSAAERSRHSASSPRERLQDVELLLPDGSLHKYVPSSKGE